VSVTIGFDGGRLTHIIRNNSKRQSVLPFLPGVSFLMRLYNRIACIFLGHEECGVSGCGRDPRPCRVCVWCGSRR